MFKHAKNSRGQGAVGLGQAIGWFIKEGYNVSIPVAECQRYDLIVEKEGILKRVEVKTTRYITPSKVYEVHLATRGGNRTGTGKTTYFSENDVDLLFVLTESGDMYLIPASEANKTTVALGKLYKRFKIT